MKQCILFIESSTTGTGPLFFERAEALGYEPILVSQDLRRYDFKVAHTIEVPDLSICSILSRVNELGRARVAGVWSSSDRAVEVAARLGQALGRPHARPEAIALCRDKFAARLKLRVAGLSAIDAALVESSREAAAFAARLNAPVVVKPRFGTGSIGVLLCRTEQEAALHTEFLLAARSAVADEKVLIEEFVDGPEYSIELFDGVSLGVTRKYLGPAPAFVEVGHEFPSPGAPALMAKIADYAERVVAVLGHVVGPAHVEVRLSEQGLNVMEVNPRAAGGMIPELVNLAIGVDLISICVKFACGEPYQVAPHQHGAAAIRFLLRPLDAAASHICGLSDARELDGIVEVAVLKQAFGRQGPITDFRDRIAFAIAKATTPTEAARFAERAIARLQVVAQEN